MTGITNQNATTVGPHIGSYRHSPKSVMQIFKMLIIKSKMSDYYTLWKLNTDGLNNKLEKTKASIEILSDICTRQWKVSFIWYCLIITNRDCNCGDLLSWY